MGHRKQGRVCQQVSCSSTHLTKFHLFLWILKVAFCSSTCCDQSVSQSLDLCRCVLELGSGLGFAGIAISKTCQPRKYVFSDCHDFVLQKLAANIVLNFHQCTCEQSSSSSLRKVDDKLCETCINFSNLFKMNFSDVCEKHWKSVGNTSTSNVRQLRTDSRVHLCSLDWEKIDEEEVRALFSDVDVVVAAGQFYLRQHASLIRFGSDFALL